MSRKQTSCGSKGAQGKQKNKTTQKNSAAGKPAAVGKPKQKRNISQTIPNGMFVFSNDENFYGTDGKSKKVRMGVVVDSNKKNEVAIVKYTTSQKHGRSFSNSKGFKGHGDKIYTLDDEKKPIKIDGNKFVQGASRRNITPKEANEIKRRNIKESPYNKGNRANLRNLKGRKNGK